MFIQGTEWHEQPGARDDRRGGVTAPRQILPGTTYLVTRRCTQRLFLLRPSVQTNQILEYCLALAARDTQVQLHSVVFMSDHWHGVVTDPHAKLPEFFERFHRLVARALNTLLGREENFWSSEKTSVVALPGHSDIIEKIAYVLTNPVSAGLVDTPSHWPGVIASFGSSARQVQIPDVFFESARLTAPQNRARICATAYLS